MSIHWNWDSMPKTPEEGEAKAREWGLLATTKRCRVHRTPMKFYDTRTHGRFRCPKKGCNIEVSGGIGSFFEECRLRMHIAIGLMYCFTRDWSYKDARHELRSRSNDLDNAELSPGTIAAWYRYCREMVVDHFSTLQQNLPKIGGPGVVVQIDESLFGHRKYNRGRVLQGHWVLGMIDSVTNDVRMVVVEQRDADTLLSEIVRHVLPGSVIHTDCWRAYDGLSSLPGQNYTHRKVNHSDPEHRFVAVDGTHTQQIEATWRPAKDFFRGRSRFADTHFADRLCEYLWRRYCDKNNIDLFESLLQAIRAAYTP